MFEQFEGRRDRQHDDRHTCDRGDRGGRAERHERWREMMMAMGRGPFARGPRGRGPGRDGFDGDDDFGGRGRFLGQGHIRLLVLWLIEAEPRHGYDLIREIESLSGEVYAPSPGVVYPTLTLLADMGLIAEQPGQGSRKLFAITDEGTAYLDEHKAGLTLVMERIASLAQKAERTDSAPVRRAMHNLRMAIQGRLEKEGADAQTMFDVASLIDEAATKIERL